MFGQRACFLASVSGFDLFALGQRQRAASPGVFTGPTLAQEYQRLSVMDKFQFEERADTITNALCGPDMDTLWAETVPDDGSGSTNAGTPGGGSTP